MTILRWNPDDVMACLEAEPWVADYETEYRYDVERHGLRLSLTVWPLEQLVYLELHRTGQLQPLQRFALYVADAIVYVHDKRGEYLEFRSCLVLPDPLYLQRPGGQEIDSIATMLGYRMQLTIKPQLRLQFAYPL
ncbi:hypothetical protein EJV47_18815 [Hymenobacter gummosus]|uniref:Uncharacterized protein n=1 Tax=Hymenobacter gummosus TaxID=1776032 RepID=A0A3S0JC90_9BACT|nr:hypothetical protein [Hymenobacter gummosus]RTQ47477.1 hypothetical protein EJV47_18815 [Hymenobacter gummosus]